MVGPAQPKSQLAPLVKLNSARWFEVAAALDNTAGVPGPTLSRGWSRLPRPSRWTSGINSGA